MKTATQAASAANAKSNRFVTSTGANKTELTLYMSGQAVVRESRHIDLSDGPNQILLEGMPEQYEPGSLKTLSVTGPGDFRIGTAVYRAANLNAIQMMHASHGKAVTIRNPNRKGAPETGTLLSLAGHSQVAVKLANGHVVVVNLTDIELNDGMPEGLSATPSLVMMPSAGKAGHYEMLLMYQCGGTEWQPSFSAYYDPKTQTLKRFECSVLLTNHSGGNFKDAVVKLLATTNNGGGSNRHYARAARAQLEFASAAPMGGRAPSYDEAGVETVGEVHMYTLPDAVTLNSGEQPQCYLLRAENVPADEEYILSNGRHDLYSEETEVPKLPVNIRLKLHTGPSLPISKALPAGEVAIYQADSSGSEQKVGSCHLNHVAVGESFNLEWGPAADVKATRRLLGFEDFEEEAPKKSRKKAAKKATGRIGTPGGPGVGTPEAGMARRQEILEAATTEVAEETESVEEPSEETRKITYREEEREVITFNYKNVPVTVVITEELPDKFTFVIPPKAAYFSKGDKSEGSNDKFELKGKSGVATARLATPPQGKTVLTYKIRYRTN